MTKEQNHDLKTFMFKVAITVAAVILVMYLAKVWFVDRRRVPSPSQGAVDEKVISWQNAAEHCGEYATVEGTIIITHNSGKACFLNFHPDYKHHFTAVIFASAFSRFPPSPEDYYDGKKVRVTGRIREYEGKPEIILRNPSQMRIFGQ